MTPTDRSTGVQQGLPPITLREAMERIYSGTHPGHRTEPEAMDDPPLPRAVIHHLAGQALAGAVSPEPREGEREPVSADDVRGIFKDYETADCLYCGATAGPPPDPSVARELRLTASRLRDPEYHWYEHAAVTLERLAEKLEAQEGERQQIIEEARRELPERDRRYGEGMGRLRDIAGPEKGRDE